VNVNTASREVLVAAFENLRQGRRMRPAPNPDDPANQQTEHGSAQRLVQYGPPIGRQRAEEIVDRIFAAGARTPDGGLLEGDEADDEAGPFTGFEDFEQRVFKPLLAEASGAAV